MSLHTMSFVDAEYTTHHVHTFCGSLKSGVSDADLTFSAPSALLTLSDGSLLVADDSSQYLRVCAADGSSVTTIVPKKATTGLVNVGPGGLLLATLPVASGHRQAAAVLVCDCGHNRLRVLSATGDSLTTLSGTGRRGHNDGPAMQASFNRPQGIAISGDGTCIFIADTGNHCVRMLNMRTNRVSTVAGRP
ncbi:hypothetical protein KIPB_011870, partial [Kipferlia bialata]|eukprot:g11870.t1